MIVACRLLLSSFQLWNDRHWIAFTDVCSFPKKLHNGEDQDSPKTDDGETMEYHQSSFPPTCGPIAKYTIARAHDVMLARGHRITAGKNDVW